MPENEEIIIGGVKLTEEEKARLAVEQWRRSRRTDVTSNFTQSSLATTLLSILGGIVIGRYAWWRWNRNKPGYVGENFLLSTRMYAQGTVALFIIGSLYFEVFQKRYLNKAKTTDAKDK